MNAVRRVLVADDDPHVRAIVAQTVQRELGVTPHVARDGGEALSCLEEADYRFDLVVVDVDMPRASGFFVLSAVDAIRPEVPVVVVSGETSHAPAAMEYGADVFLAKPFMVAHLARVLRTVCDSTVCDASEALRASPAVRATRAHSLREGNGPLSRAWDRVAT